VFLQNLTGSQISAPAEINRQESSDVSKDDQPLEQLSKRRRIMLFDESAPGKSPIHSGIIASVSAENLLISSTASAIPKVITFKNNSYKWTSNDIRPSHKLWQNVNSPVNCKNPIDCFECN
jgi:hypothetical protein